MKVLLSGGGTGGHVYPAVCIGKAIKKKIEDTELLFVGTRKGMEMDIVPREGIQIRTIRIRGLKRAVSVDNLKAVLEVFTSLNEARRIIKDFKPDLVVGTGGYVCGPVLLAASLMGIPTLIHEQNAAPGITNRILSGFVERVAVTYEGTEKHFKNPEKVFVSGNPIRESFHVFSREDGLVALGLDPRKPLVLVTGGSLGAKSINLAVARLAKECFEKGEFQLFHVTGSNTYEMVRERYRDLGINELEKGDIRIVPYLNKMAEALCSASLVIGRSGAGILAEMAVAGSPAILVPYPYATNNHQEMNGRAFEAAGGGIVLLEKELSEDSLYDIAMGLLKDPNKLRQMSESAKAYSKPDSAAFIADEAIRMVESRRGAK